MRGMRASGGSLLIKHTQIASNLLLRVFFENIGSAKPFRFFRCNKGEVGFSKANGRRPLADPALSFLWLVLKV